MKVKQLAKNKLVAIWDKIHGCKQMPCPRSRIPGSTGLKLGRELQAKHNSLNIITNASKIKFAGKVGKFYRVLRNIVPIFIQNKEISKFVKVLVHYWSQFTPKLMVIFCFLCFCPTKFSFFFSL